MFLSHNSVTGLPVLPNSPSPEASPPARLAGSALAASRAALPGACADAFSPAATTIARAARISAFFRICAALCGSAPVGIAPGRKCTSASANKACAAASGVSSPSPAPKSVLKSVLKSEPNSASKDASASSSEAPPRTPPITRAIISASSKFSNSPSDKKANGSFDALLSASPISAGVCVFGPISVIA